MVYDLIVVMIYIFGYYNRDLANIECRTGQLWEN